MQAVYWYAVLLLQPTLYLVSAPRCRGERGGEGGSSPAENEQTHGNCRRLPGSPGPVRGYRGGNPATSAPLGDSGLGGLPGATSWTGPPGASAGTATPPGGLPGRLRSGGNFLRLPSAGGDSPPRAPQQPSSTVPILDAKPGRAARSEERSCVGFPCAVPLVLWRISPEISRGNASKQRRYLLSLPLSPPLKTSRSNPRRAAPSQPCLMRHSSAERSAEHPPRGGGQGRSPFSRSHKHPATRSGDAPAAAAGLAGAGGGAARSAPLRDPLRCRGRAAWGRCGPPIPAGGGGDRRGAGEGGGRPGRLRAPPAAAQSPAQGVAAGPNPPSVSPSPPPPPPNSLPFQPRRFYRRGWGYGGRKVRGE